MNRLFLFSKRDNSSRQIIIVSGLPRSGTSMMMKMLEAGGLQLLTDNLRKADSDNPKGYYEFERAKKLKDGDVGWLPQAEGKAVKIISALLPHLPSNYTFKVLFMERNISEVLASQRQMLLNRNEVPDKVSDAEMASIFQRHLDQVINWMHEQSNIQYININYNALLEKPIIHIERITKFLGDGLDIQTMAEVIDPDLYRHRK